MKNKIERKPKKEKKEYKKRRIETKKIYKNGARFMKRVKKEKKSI